MSQKYASQQPSGFNNQIKNVAIVGAAGNVGKFIVAELLKKGTFNVTAISREGSSNKPADGVKVAAVKYDDPPTIVSALKGQDAFIIILSVQSAPETQQILIKAAAEAGVPYILPNEFGSGGDNNQLGQDILIGVQKKADRDLIESLGISNWVGIATGFWYEYSLAAPGFFGIHIRNREALFYDDGTVPMNVSSWPQVGRSVAAVLSLPILPENEEDQGTTLSGYANKFVFTTSFKVTQKSMFESVKRVTNTSDADWKISSKPAREQYKESMEKLMAGDRMAFGNMLYSRLFCEDEPANFEKHNGLDNEKLGLKEEDLDSWTKEAVKMSDAWVVEKMFGMA